MSKDSDIENAKYWARSHRSGSSEYESSRAEVWEHIIRGAITKNRAALQEILYGVHEAMHHSDAIGHDCTEKQLMEFYTKLDALIACSLVQEKDD